MIKTTAENRISFANDNDNHYHFIEMNKIIFNTLFLLLAVVFAQNAWSAITPLTSPANLMLGGKPFYYEGHIYFNVTHSGLQGERYLLNQQLSNIKLNSELILTEQGKFRSLFIYNTVPTPITPRFYFEQAFYEYTYSDRTKFYLGKLWVPFGHYKNDLIYKTFAKALGQTNDPAFVLEYQEQFYSHISLFHPHSKVESFSWPNYYNIDVGFHKNKQNMSLGFISSIADSQLFQYNKGFGGFLGQTIQSHVPGLAFNAHAGYQKLNVYLSSVMAIRAFDINELSYQHKGAKPAAYSIQAGYPISLKNIPAKWIVFFDVSQEALALRLPKKSIGFGINLYPSRYCDIQFQYLRDYDYGSHIQSSGLDQPVLGRASIKNTFALQLVVNF